MTVEKVGRDSWDENKEQIVAIAAQLFGRYGFKKTTLDDIAQAVRKAKSSIYYYFENKESIFEAVVEREVDQLREALRKSIGSSSSPQQKLTIFIKTRMKVIKKLVNFWAIKTNDEFPGLEFVEKMRKKYDTEEIGYLSEILKDGMVLGLFRIQKPQLSAIAIAMAMKGLEAPLFLEGVEENEQEAHIEELIEILFNGLLVR
ncbi:MAG TPA: TetR/AcrR family transcriptional regulator [Williamwhitmania sp.]|nr:TetR/AcrR family transcriptional regulator [Williamwhitmania sp.]